MTDHFARSRAERQAMFDRAEREHRALTPEEFQTCVDSLMRDFDDAILTAMGALK